MQVLAWAGAISKKTVAIYEEKFGEKRGAKITR
jgi:hypothetical protein